MNAASTIPATVARRSAGLLTLFLLLLQAGATTASNHVLWPLPSLADDIAALTDSVGGGNPDYVIYRGDVQNEFTVLDGNSGATLRTLKFFSSPWQPYAFASLADGNSDGTPNDPALAVLARNTGTGQLKVQLRDSVSNTVLANVTTFSSEWNPQGLAILTDSNGNGVANDPAAAVLAQNTIDGRNTVELVRLSDGATLGRWTFFRPHWEVKAVAAYVPAGGVPRIAVLATNPDNGQTKVQYRLTTGGGRIGIFAFGADVDTFDMGVVMDSNGNGTANDPAFAIIGKKLTGTGNNIVRIIRESDGARLDEWRVISSSYNVRGMALLPDINFTGYADIAALAQPIGGGNLLVQVRDLETGASIDTLTGPPALAALPGLDARPSNTACIAPEAPDSDASYTLERVFSGINLSSPLWMGQPPADSSRWFVAEKNGRIVSFANNAGASSTTTVLNLAISNPPDEGGLLGFAFAPDFATSGKAYVSYTRNVNSGGVALQSVVSRFTSADGGQTLNPASEQIILVINHFASNHNGGNIAFGPDGYLYLGMGDGGGNGDPEDNGQDTTNLLGTFIRVDVSGSGTGYSIPSDNPFAANPVCTNGFGSQPCPEIYAWGLRNPFRWNFDSATGDLWAGDVGNNLREEVSVIERGGNYGWVTKEGFACLDPFNNEGELPSCDDAGMIDPIVDYPSGSGSGDLGRSVIGGLVYRGTELSALQGRYVFGDAYSSTVWTINDDGNGNHSLETLIPNSGIFLAHFAEGNDGEAYVVSLGGSLYKLVENTSSGNNTIPDLLSETGCMVSNASAPPPTGLIPFTPGAAFWSDGADKHRWLAIPNGTSIAIDAEDDFVFPQGTVLIKNFERGGELIETRLFMRHTGSNDVWAGYTYRWNEAGTDAERVVGGATVEAGGGDWLYPSETQCLECHTAAAGRSLGPELPQLNNAIVYPTTGRTANQLFTLDSITMLSPPLGDDPENLPAFPDPFGNAPLEERARAYLHTNCSGCHRPSNPLQATMDLRYDTPLPDTNTCNAASISGGNLGISGAKLILPGDPSRSLIPVRMGRRDARAMPPLGSLIADAAGVQLISDWIDSLSPADCN